MEGSAADAAAPSAVTMRQRTPLPCWDGHFMNRTARRLLSA